MEFSIFKIFTIFGIVSAWATKAFEDGKVTLTEAAELAFKLCGLLGIPTELDLPEEVRPGSNSISEADSAAAEADARAPPADIKSTLPGNV